MIISCIYEIRSVVNPAKFYIGSAVNFLHRKWGHVKELTTKKHGNIHLQNHVNKYGITDLMFYIIERVYDKNDLLKREQFYIDNYRPTFNICKVAGSQLGVIHGPEYRLKLRQAKAKSGYKHTEETKKKLSEAHTGKKMSKDSRKKMSQSKTGTKHSDEHKLKISHGNKGLKRTPETKAKIKAAKTGVIYSIESRLKMSQSQKLHRQKLIS